MAPTLTVIGETHGTIPASATGTIVSGSFTPAVGDVLVVKATSQDSPITPTSIAGGGLVWTSQVNVVPPGNTGCPARIWTAIATAAAAMTVTVTYTSGSTAATPGSFFAERWSQAALAATPATGQTPANAPDTTSPWTSTITTTIANSVVSWLDADWNAHDPAGAAYVSPGVQDGTYYNATHVTAYYAHQPAPTPGAQTFGLSAPAGQTATLAALEIIPPVTPGDYRLFASVTPGGTYSAAGNFYTLGTEFRVGSACTLKGLWYYRPSTATTATPTGAAWAVAADGASGTLLAGSTVTFAAGSATGWIYQALPSPVTLAVGQSYRVGVYFSNTLFAYDGPYWTSGAGANGVTSGPITAPSHANAVGTRQGSSHFTSTDVGLAFPEADGNQFYGVDVTVTVPGVPVTVVDQASGAEAGSPAGSPAAGTVVADQPAGAESGVPVETVTARPQGPQDQPSGAETGSPASPPAGGTVLADQPAGAEAGSPTDRAVPNTATFDTASGAEEGAPGDTIRGDTVITDRPAGAEPGQPGGVQVPLPPTLTLGQVSPTELDVSLAYAPQVAEATLRFYGALGSAFTDGDAAHNYPLLRFLDAPGRLLQNIEDLTRDQGSAPGWSALFDLTRAPTYALPWLGQTVGVSVDPTVSDAAQRRQIVTESGQARGTVTALQQATLSFLQGPSPVVDVIERDGNPWTVTVAIYASQLVGMSYAKLSENYPTYTMLSAAYATYQQYAVGFSELYQALAQVKPAGLLLNLYVRTGPSYASLSGADLTYTAAAARYLTYAVEIGSQPVTS